jgi:hypothetical protein
VSIEIRMEPFPRDESAFSPRRTGRLLFVVRLIRINGNKTAE